MSSNDQNIHQLQLATQYMAFGFGFPVLVIGLTGNILNLIIFLSLDNYKTNVSSFYMVCKSFFDLNTLILGLIGHIIIQSFRNDSLTSPNWCQFRIPLLYINSLCSSTCLCLQSIDCYICSSRNVNIRQQSTIKKGRYLIIIFSFVWICNEFPYYLMKQVNIIPNWRCQTTNTIYAQYRSYFTVLSLSIIVPILIISLFGYLTYRNLHVVDVDQRHRLNALTKQTTRMVLYEIGIVLFFECPYGISQIYSASTTNIIKTPYRQTQEQFATVFFFIYAYIVNASPFYSYCLASKRFREQVIDRIKRFPFNGRANRIVPQRQTAHGHTQKQTTHFKH